MALGDLLVRIRATATEFAADVRSVQSEAKTLEKSLKPLQDAGRQIGLALTGAGAAISAIGVPFAIAAQSAIDTADAFNDMSQRVGVSVESLSALAFAAQQSGTSIDAIETGLKRLSSAAVDASNGSKTAGKTFADLGISVTDANGSLKSSDALLLEVADRFSTMTDLTKKTAIAVDLFGKSGTDLIPILNEGSTGINKLKGEADSLGKVLSTETAKSADEFNDSVDRLKSALTGVVNAIISSGLLDKLAAFISKAAEIVSEFTKAHPTLVTIAGAIGALSAVVGPLVLGLGLFVTAISSLIGPISLAITWLGGAAGLSAAIGAVVAVLTGPVGIAIAIAAVVTAIGVFIAKNETVKTVLSDIWTGLKTALTTALDTMKNAWDALWSYIIDTPKRIKDKVVGAVTGVTNGIIGAFQSMYDKVVGKSIVPDMIDGIEAEFGKLGKVMLDPVKSVTVSVVNEIGGMLDGVINKFTDKIPVIGQTVGNLLKSISDKFINLGLDKLFGGSLGGIFSGGGGGLPNAGRGASGGVGSALSLAGGLATGIGAGIGSFLGSLIGGGRQEGTLNAIEENTRFTWLILKNTLEQVLHPVGNLVNFIAEQTKTLGYDLIPEIAYWGQLTLDTIWQAATSVTNQIVDAVHAIKIAAPMPAAAPPTPPVAPKAPAQLVIPPASMMDPWQGFQGGTAAGAAGFRSIFGGSSNPAPQESEWAAALRSIFGGVPAYAGGLVYANRRHLAIIDEGEAVLTRSQNMDRASKVVVNLNIENLTGTDEASARRLAAMITRYVEKGGGTLTGSRLKY